MTIPYIDPYSAASSVAGPGAAGSMLPGAALGASEMTINTSSLNVSANAAGGLFGYSDVPTMGTLLFSIAPVGGQDIYGNTYPTGLVVSQGQLTGVSLIGIGMDATSIISGATLSNGNVVQPVINGGTATSSLLVLNQAGGQVLSYSSSTASSTFTATGLWTCPAGVTQARVQCWGAGSGGGGGDTVQGGETGGGGEYAEEPGLTVVPGVVYTVSVGLGGQGGSTGSSGQAGGDTVFQDQLGNNLVYAHGGQAGVTPLGGAGGTGSLNSVHFDGGSGAAESGNTGGSGAGSSAGPVSAGNTGVQSAGSTGGAGGAAPSGGGGGGAGGGNAANGVAGSASGGGGGGAGAGTASNAVTETFYPVVTYSYYSDSGLRNTNSNMFHGAYSGEAPNYQYTYIQWDTGSLGHALNTVLNLTVNWVTLRLTNLHSWYNNGMTFGLHWSNTLGGAQGVYSTLLSSAFISEGNTYTYTLGSAVWSPFQTAGRYLVLSPDSADLTNLNWYGYFYGGGGATSSMPRIQVNYQSTGVGSFTGGGGADGKVIVSYETGASLVGVVSPNAGSDGLGNSFAPGVTATQHTMLAQSLAPATPASAVVVYADTLSKARVVTPSTYNGVLQSCNVDTAQFTVTGTSFAQLSKLWSIPAADANTGTVYRLTIFGNGTWGTATSPVLNFELTAFGSNVSTIGVGATFMAAGSGFSWHLTANVMITATGVSGSMVTMMGGEISVKGSNLIVGGSASANATAGIVSQNNTTTVNTTTSQTIELQADWGSPANSATITSFGSILERLG